MMFDFGARLRVFVFLCLGVCGSVFGQDGETLRVGVAGSEPFVVENSGSVKGFSVDVWEKLAVKSGRGFDFVGFESVGKGLDALEANKVDVVVGPVSITADRQERFAFTQPYFTSSLGIVSRDEGVSVWDRVKPFFSLTFFIALGVFLVILTVVGFLVWVVERRACDGPFSEGPVKGLGNGIWLALVTMTTVGYGDLAPKTVFGRVVLGGWMVVALVSATSLLAGLAGTIALSSGDGVKVEVAGDLSGKAVAVVADSPGEDFVKRHGGRRVYVESLVDAMSKLEKKEVGAVVFDRPQLRFFLDGKDDLGFRLSAKKYQEQGYGFAFRKGDKTVGAMNVALLRLQESGFLDDVEAEWLPPVVE